MEKRQKENESEESNDDELLHQENKTNREKTTMSDMLDTYYKNMQHMRSHGPRRKCEFCDKSYIRLEDLRIHKKNIHGNNKTFDMIYDFTRHKFRGHDSRFSCRH